MAEPSAARCLASSPSAIVCSPNLEEISLLFIYGGFARYLWSISPSSSISLEMHARTGRCREDVRHRAICAFSSSKFHSKTLPNCPKLKGTCAPPDPGELHELLESLNRITDHLLRLKLITSTPQEQYLT